MKKILLLIIPIIFIFINSGCQTVKNKTDAIVEKENEKLSKYIGKSSNELQTRNEELSEQTIESISTFSNLIDQQKSEIDRLKEGYDFSIKKHSIKALVELKSLIANFYKEELSQETKEKLDKITNYINLDLEELDVEELNGVALMTDTDNSKLRAISYYQNIFFSSN